MVKKVTFAIIASIAIVAILMSVYYYQDYSSSNKKAPPIDTVDNIVDMHGTIEYYTYNESSSQVNVQILKIKPQRALNTSTFSGADLGERINKADEACGVTSCQINVDETGTISTPIALSDNRIVAFGHGTYTISAQIRLGNNNEFYGSNSTIFIRDPKFFEGMGADLRSSPAGNFNDIDDADMIKAQGKKNVLIHDLQINGNTAAIGHYPIEGVIPKPTGKLYQMPMGRQSEISFVDSSNILVSNVTVSQVQTHAVAGVGLSDLVIKNCNFSSDGWNKYQLVWLGQKHNQNLIIKNNLIHNSSHAGLFIGFADNGAIVNNTFDHNRVNTFFTGSGGQIGLQEHTSNISIINNTIINAGYTPADEIPKRGKALLGHGMVILGYNITITGNIVSNNSGFGIVLHNNQDFNSLMPDEEVPPAHDILIQNNTITGNGYVTGEHAPIFEQPGLYNIIIRDNKIDQPSQVFTSIPDDEI